MIKKMLLFGYKESETNLMDLLITNLCGFIAKTHFFFSTEQYADPQNIRTLSNSQKTLCNRNHG